MNYLWISCLLLSISTNFISGSLQISKRSLHSEKLTSFFSHRECSKNFTNNFGKVILESKCKPRPTLVDIISPYTNILVDPNKVVVNRCGGVCHAKLSCFPTQKKTVEVMVQQMDFLQHDTMPKCGVVHVEEHVRCKCKCTVMPEDCKDKQVYIAGECMCFCMNLEEKRKCIEAGKSWDDEKCSCMCPVQRECTTPYVWLRDYCRCAKLMSEEEMIQEEEHKEEN